jgi:CspA family cold shock protein
MRTGTVVWFKNDHGFGFIKPSDGGADVFCHHTSIRMDGYRQLNQGDEVEFDVEIGPKGKPQACDVRILRRSQVA